MLQQSTKEQIAFSFPCNNITNLNFLTHATFSDFRRRNRGHPNQDQKAQNINLQTLQTHNLLA